MKVTTMVPAELRPVAYAALFLIARDDRLMEAADAPAA